MEVKVFVIYFVILSPEKIQVTIRKQCIRGHKQLANKISKQCMWRAICRKTQD